MTAEDLIKSNSLTNIEVTAGQTVVFTEIALTAVNMARMESKQSPWISVEERLPEEDGSRVWVKSDFFDKQPLVYSKGKFYSSLRNGCYDGSVTHWMPIPE